MADIAETMRRVGALARLDAVIRALDHDPAALSTSERAWLQELLLPIAPDAAPAGSQKLAPQAEHRVEWAPIVEILLESRAEPAVLHKSIEELATLYVHLSGTLPVAGGHREVAMRTAKTLRQYLLNHGPSVIASAVDSVE